MLRRTRRKADGIKFTEYSVRALAKAIRKALALYAIKPLLDHYRRNGMARDFSWERTAAAYQGLYQRLPARRHEKFPRNEIDYGPRLIRPMALEICGNWGHPGSVFIIYDKQAAN